MALMTEGLKLAAGQSLARLLARATQTRLRGLMTGVAVTALVQSSSAVTVAIIGFVHAGLMSLVAALWVLFGSNVGTTMTAWIVALVGLKFKIEALALPLIALGALLRLTGPGTRRGHFGTALAGFGLLFLGLGLLQSAFVAAAKAIELPRGTGVVMLLLQLAIGTSMTVLMQSSSASMAVALTAAHSGLISLESAAAVVIGANIGTTVTAVLAGIGATANAKRVALAHVLFNVLTGVAALLLLPWLLGLLLWLARRLSDEPGAAAVLALFHTSFNLLGVLLMWPLADRLSHWLQQRFVTAEGDLRPQYLDRTVLGVPTLALDALAAEMRRLSGFVQALLAQLPGQAPKLQQLQTLSALGESIDRFAESIHRGQMTPTEAARLSELLRAERHLESCLELLDDWPAEDSIASAGEAAQAIESEFWNSLHTLDLLPASYDDLQKAYRKAKSAHLDAAARGEESLRVMDEALRCLSLARRAGKEWHKAQRLLVEPRTAQAVSMGAA